VHPVRQTHQLHQLLQQHNPRSRLIPQDRGSML
jgi:hypothetical protein